MSTLKFIALGIAVFALIACAILRDFFFDPKKFIREMREANDAEQ